ncbi:hypothetical protein ACHQM5_014987 [Ranunculus cassubicifolius]
MGCNESKQAVATSDTISRRPFRKKLPSLTFKTQDSLSDKTVAIPANNPPSSTTDDVKDISVNTDLKDQELEKGNEEIVVVQPGKLISSPDHFFSSRKDEDVAESVDTEEGYFSPNHDSVKDVELKSDCELKEEDEKVNDQENVSSVDHEKKIKDDEKGKLENLEEPNSSKIDEQQNVEVFESPPVTAVEDEKNLVVPVEAPTDTLTESSKIG